MRSGRAPITRRTRQPRSRPTGTCPARRTTDPRRATPPWRRHRTTMSGAPGHRRRMLKTIRRRMGPIPLRRLPFLRPLPMTRSCRIGEAIGQWRRTPSDTALHRGRTLRMRLRRVSTPKPSLTDHMTARDLSSITRSRRRFTAWTRMASPFRRQIQIRRRPPHRFRRTRSQRLIPIEPPSMTDRWSAAAPIARRPDMRPSRSGLTRRPSPLCISKPIERTGLHRSAHPAPRRPMGRPVKRSRAG